MAGENPYLSEDYKNRLQDSMNPEIPQQEIPTEAIPNEQDTSAPVDAPAEGLIQEQELSDEAKGALFDLLKSARDEDRFVRDRLLIQARRLEYYWNNLLDILWDPTARDWRVPDWDALAESGEVAPRLINIYRPHGEAIVAALSVSIPTIIFHPDDADNPDDIEAAKAYRSLAELIDSHDNAAMLFIRAIVIMFNQGTIFGYNYYHTDPKFGTLEKPRVEFKDIEIFSAYCPKCGEPLDSGVAGKEEQNYQCQNCGYSGPAEISNTSESLPQIVGFDKSPKGTICRKLYSLLNVKVPAYAEDQYGCGYLLCEFSQATAMLRSVFKDKAIKINSQQNNQHYEDFFKLPIQYLGASPENASNVSCVWFRPWQFWQLNPEKIELINELTAAFPNGCYAIFINDVFMEAHDENMDEHWTISRNPLGSFVYAKPLGENLATVQDIRAQLVEIELQTAEYGIPETFVDEKVLDFNQYGKGRAQPGMVTAVKPRSGKSISDAFFTTKSAILSQEIDPLRQHIDQDAQFVVGSFPSVYGGPATGGSKTASEYSQSRSIALQRLGTTWKIVCDFWAALQSRSVIEYANVLKDLGRDEKFTKREGSNNFINVWIRQTSLSGKVGRVEPEASEQLPQSWAQKKDIIFQLMQSGVDPVLQVLTHPNNAGVMKDIIGLSELYVPGEEDRLRQFKEFQMLSQGIPVPINPMVDNNEVHIEVLKGILEGPLGESLSNEGKQASMMHLQEHMQAAAQNAATQPGMNPAESGPAPERPQEKAQ